MNIGGVSMQAPAQAAAAGVMKSAMDTQASAVAKLMGGGDQATNDMMQAVMAGQGKGQNLNLSV